MPRAASFCGVILAAGASSRMGRDKALLPWPPQALGAVRENSRLESKHEFFPSRLPEPPNEFFSSTAATPMRTFLSAQIELLQPFTDIVIVVAGRNASALKSSVYALGAALVQNPDPDRGQFSSLQTGLQEVLNRGRDGALVTLVDRPPASRATVQKIRDAFCATDPAQTWAVVPEANGRHGHPIAIGREMIGAFLRAPLTSTARDVEHASQEHILYIPVDDPNITLNVNTPEEYEALRR